MARKKSFGAAAAAAVVVSLCALAGCAPKTVNLNFSGDVPDTPHCEFMKDACKEAMAFQSRYEAMPREEKDEAKIIMNAYTQQCVDAQELCRRSAGQ